jgi:acetylornithine deacetylase/succinyl-diaminopimelate desuccinylase-like protein
MAILPLDWRTITDEAVSLLQALLRVDTTNPPGNETAATEILAGFLRKEGLSPELLAKDPARANLVCRLPGDGSGGGPLLLNAHLDVVPSRAEAWRRPPFSGEIFEGCLWGRGAVDMKHMAAMSAVVLAQLRRSNVPLRRDLIFAAVADEEAGCEYGSRFLVTEHPEKVRAEYVLGEVGGFTLHFGGKRLYPVQVAEKGVAWLKIRVRGTPGHGSIPHGDNAVVKLARALARIGQKRLPQHNTPAVERFLQRLAELQPLPARLAIPLLLRPEFSGIILNTLIPERRVAESFAAALSNTATPTVLRAGDSTNVIPDTAEAELDGRTLPGQNEHDLIRELKDLVGEDFDFEVIRAAPPVESPEDPAVFRAIQETLDEHEPGAVAIPYLVPGYTDAKEYHRLGAKYYGFAPVRLPPGMKFAEMFHGNDERIPEDGFRWGVRVLFEVVRKLAGEPGG